MSSLKYVLISLLFLIFISCGGSSKTSTETEDMTLSEEESSLRISELIENIEDDPNNLDWRLQLAREYEALDRNMEALKKYSIQIRQILSLVMLNLLCGWVINASLFRPIKIFYLVWMANNI
jgi:hypothetical protein